MVGLKFKDPHPVLLSKQDHNLPTDIVQKEDILEDEQEAMDDQVEVVDVSDVKIEPENSSSSMFSSLTSTTSTFSPKAFLVSITL